MKLKRKTLSIIILFLIVATVIFFILYTFHISQKNKIINQLNAENSGFDQQWALYNDGQEIREQNGTKGIDINILKAWSLTKGTKDIIVGVLDSGIDIQNVTIKNNIYTNTAEIPDNGIDDDLNGYIDDVNGWNFYNNNNIIYEGSLQDYHGTHISGIIAATDNNGTICGVSPYVKILPLKFLRGSKGQISDAINAIHYAYTLGVQIINCSWDTEEYNEELFQTMKKYSNILFICSAGKNKKDLNKHPVYPACFDLPNVICVTAIDNQGNLEKYTNYGEKAHVAAPGVDIYSCMPEGDFTYLSGSSSATGYVSGIAALVKSYHPEFTSIELADILKEGTKTLSRLNGKVESGGIIDAYLCLKESDKYSK